MRFALPAKSCSVKVLAADPPNVAVDAIDLLIEDQFVHGGHGAVIGLSGLGRRHAESCRSAADPLAAERRIPFLTQKRPPPPIRRRSDIGASSGLP